MPVDHKNGKGYEPPKTMPRMKERGMLAEEPPLGVNEVKVVLRYVHGEREKTEEVIVPRSLIAAMTEPGESGLSAMAAMKQLSEFFYNRVKPELKEMFINGSFSVPVALISSQIRHSYETHALIAATENQTSESLFLENEEVQKRLRIVAAIVRNVSVEEIRKLDLEETTIQIGPRRIVTSVEKTPEITLGTREIACECDSHTEYRKATFPARTTIAEARNEREQRLTRMPKIREALDSTYGKIEDLRGKPLDREERNVVVAHLNARFIEKPEDRLIVTV